MAVNSSTDEANLKKAQPPAKSVVVQRGKSETLIVTSVPATDAASVELYNSTLIVPVGDAAREAMRTAIPSMVITPGVVADDATYEVVRAVFPLSDSRYVVEFMTAHVEASVLLPSATAISRAMFYAIVSTPAAASKSRVRVSVSLRVNAEP